MLRMVVYKAGRDEWISIPGQPALCSKTMYLKNRDIKFKQCFEKNLREGARFYSKQHYSEDRLLSSRVREKYRGRAEAKARKSKASGVRLFWVDPLAVSCVPGHFGM